MKKKKIYPSFVDFRKNTNSEEKAEKSFMALFKDIIKKAKSNLMAVTFLRDSPKDFLEYFRDVDPIENPSEVFQFNISDDSKMVIQDQTVKTPKAIKRAIQTSDYPFLKYKLEELESLSDLLEQSYIKYAYDDCISFVTKDININYEQTILAFNRYLVGENQLEVEDIKRYLESIQQSERVEELRSYLPKEAAHTMGYTLNLSFQVNRMCLDLKDKKLEDVSIKSTLEELKILSNFFPEIKNKFTEGFKIVAEQTIFQSLVSLNEFSKCADELTRFSQAVRVG